MSKSIKVVDDDSYSRRLVQIADSILDPSAALEAQIRASLDLFAVNVIKRDRLSQSA